MLAQRGLVIGVQGRQICPGRADTEREPLPPLLEAGVAYADGQRGDLRSAQPGLREELGQMAFADTGQARLIVGGGIQLAHGRPERGQRSASARVVPHARRDHPAGTGDPAHLPQALSLDQP